MSRSLSSMSRPRGGEGGTWSHVSLGAEIKCDWGFSDCGPAERIILYKVLCKSDLRPVGESSFEWQIVLQERLIFSFLLPFLNRDCELRNRTLIICRGQSASVVHLPLTRYEIVILAVGQRLTRLRQKLYSGAGSWSGKCQSTPSYLFFFLFLSTFKCDMNCGLGVVLTIPWSTENFGRFAGELCV